MDLSKYIDLFVADSRDNLETLMKAVLELEQADGVGSSSVNEIFRAVHTIKGSAAALELDDVRTLAHRLEDLLSPRRDSGKPVPPWLLEVLVTCHDLFLQLLDEVEADGTTKTSTAPLMGVINKAAAMETTSSPAAAAAAAAAAASSSEVVADGPVKKRPTLEENLQETLLAQLRAEAGVQRKIDHFARGRAQLVRVQVERLDVLMNLVGELVINKIRLNSIAEQHSIEPMTKALDQTDRLISDLQNEVMKIRMVPVSQVFDTFPRLVRDISKNVNKQVDFQVSGRNIELDRSVLEEVREPLIHIIRNAIDHGLETAEVRRSAGKNPTGHLQLSARRERGRVVIEVADDGAGIDPEKVTDVAVKRGLLSSDQAGSLREDEAVHLIFLPGFSTAEKVSELSGRGVGMDMVKRKVEDLGGEILLESEVAKGSSIQFHLPLTMAIIHALMVGTGDEIYALPLSSVREIVTVDGELHTVGGRPLLDLRDQVIPLVFLGDILGTADQKDADEYTIVVLQRGEQLVGLVVDALLGQQEIVIKNLSSHVGEVDGVSGATITGDGSVVLILDPARLF